MDDTNIFFNIFFTLLGLSGLLVLGSFLLPHFEKAIENKINMNFDQGEGAHGMLSEVFYRYNHRDAHEWFDWINTQPNETKSHAIEMLVTHIESDPSSWGNITSEAIFALGKFARKDLDGFFKDLLIRCKKFWKKFKICQSCYEGALKGIVKINELEAIKVFANEIAKLSLDGQTQAIVRATQEFSEEADLEPIIINIICNAKFSYHSKKEILSFMQNRDLEQAKKIVREALFKYLNNMNQFELDELRMIDDLLQIIIMKIDDESYKIILKACNHVHVAATAIRLVEKKIRDKPNFFNEEQKYNLLFTQYDKNKIIQVTLSEIEELNSDEKKLIEVNNIAREFPFTKGPMVEETFDKHLIIPAIGLETYALFKDCSKQAGMSQETAGGLLLSGEANDEKILYSRAICSERKWTFIYTEISGLLCSEINSNTKNLIERVNSCKPCLVYLDGIEDIITGGEDSISRNLVQILADSMICLVGSTTMPLEIDEDGNFELNNDNEIIRTLFPKALSVNQPTLAEKNTFLATKLNKLEHKREHQNHEQYNILQPCTGMSLFEYDNYISRYFRASLLTSGRLINSSDFLSLEKSRERYKDL